MISLNLNFDAELSEFETEPIKSFAKLLIDELPNYFWDVPASSSGKYHPKHDIFNHGLYYHTIAVFQMLNHLLTPEFMQEMYTETERDCARCAVLVHDGWKSGNVKPDGSYEDHTIFTHPLVAKEHILAHRDDGIIAPATVELIADTVSSHMGQWNTSKYNPDVTLPKPTSRLQQVVHMADYLASRKDIITIEPYYKVDVKENAEDLSDLAGCLTCKADDYVIHFGIHNGQTYGEVKKEDPNYLLWIFNNGKVPDDLRNVIVSDMDNLKAAIRKRADASFY